MARSSLFRRWLGGAASLACLGAVAAIGYRAITAADHLDPPLRTDPAADTNPDEAADLADVFLFHTADHLVMAVTFSGPQATTLPASYDRDLIYTFNLSNDGDPATTEFPIEVRFGQDPAGNHGVRFTGLPGGTVIEGPVETNLQRDGIMARAGLFDDPFFFDLQGFRETRSSGNLAFNNQRNFFAGQNLTAIVIQIPLTRVRDGNQLINLWVSADRFGGQI